MTEASKVVKCVVWDLDNTLWRGTLLEDGDVELTEGLREVLAERAYALPEVRCYPTEQALSLMDIPDFTPASAPATPSCPG